MQHAARVSSGMWRTALCQSWILHYTQVDTIGGRQSTARCAEGVEMVQKWYSAMGARRGITSGV